MKFQPRQSQVGDVGVLIIGLMLYLENLPITLLKKIKIWQLNLFTIGVPVGVVAVVVAAEAVSAHCSHWLPWFQPLGLLQIF